MHFEKERGAGESIVYQWIDERSACHALHLSMPWQTGIAQSCFDYLPSTRAHTHTHTHTHTHAHSHELTSHPSSTLLQPWEHVARGH